MKKIMSYAVFTPPWFRHKLVCKDLSITFPTFELPDLRSLRSAPGKLRIVAILAGFIHNEYMFSNLDLDFIITNLDMLKTRLSPSHNSPNLTENMITATIPTQSKTFPRLSCSTNIPSPTILLPIHKKKL